jgi:hypothetical protein
MHQIEALTSQYTSALFALFARLEGRAAGLEETLKAVISLMQLDKEANAEVVESFKTIWKEHMKKITPASVRSVVSGWIVYNKMQSLPAKETQHAYLAYLKRLHVFYSRILKQVEGGDLEVARSCLVRIQEKYTAFNRRYFVAEVNLVFRGKLLDIEQKALREIFQHYALQHLFIGKTPTFSHISQQKQVWDCGTFIAFCKGFVFNSLWDMNKKRLIIDVFKKHSKLNIEMAFEGFLQALDDIVEMAYNSGNDLKNALKKSQLTKDEKKILLFEEIEMADLTKIKEKLKELKNAFAGNSPEHRRSCSNIIKSRFPSVPDKLFSKYYQIKQEGKVKRIRRENCKDKNEEVLTVRYQSASNVMQIRGRLSRIRSSSFFA